MPPLIEFWQSGHAGDFTWPMFLRHVEDAGLRTIATRSWPTRATTFEAAEFDRRMVSVTDGLIGQGVRVLILVTTNEQLGRLHPAIVRPGRCASQISFDPLTAAEAEAWLADRGAPRPMGSTTIAELYGIIQGHEPAKNEKVVGFQLRRG